MGVMQAGQDVSLRCKLLVALWEQPRAEGTGGCCMGPCLWTWEEELKWEW